MIMVIGKVNGEVGIKRSKKYVTHYKNNMMHAFLLNGQKMADLQRTLHMIMIFPYLNIWLFTMVMDTLK